MAETKILDDTAVFRLLEGVALQAHRDAAGVGRKVSQGSQLAARLWLAWAQNVPVGQERTQPPNKLMRKEAQERGTEMLRQQMTGEPTAAGRLAVAQDGLRRLRGDKAAAQGRKLEAQTVLDELTVKLAGLQRAKDLAGEDVGAALLDTAEQRTEAARQVSIASAEAVEIAQRIAALNAELPALEVAALQDELCAAVAAAGPAALAYRAALEGLLDAALTFQTAVRRCEGLAHTIAAKGQEPRTRLRAGLVAGEKIDRVLRVARDTGGDRAALAGAMAELFDKW